MTDILILAGTLLPVAGPALAVFIGLQLRGRARLAMLLAGPVITLLPCYYFAPEIGNNGNMLFIALFGVAAVSLLIYYPVLVGILLIRKTRRIDPG